jgi:hypothetical protein
MIIHLRIIKLKSYLYYTLMLMIFIHIIKRKRTIIYIIKENSKMRLLLAL